MDGLKKILVLFVIACLMHSVSPRHLHGWSSMDQTGTGGIYSTHQLLSTLAYDILKSHPAFRHSGFPSLQDILRHSGVNAAHGGLGPDATENSCYSEHWYNPNLAGNGKALANIDSLHQGMVRELFQLSDPDLANARAHRERLAHNTAYLAHFIQDMTCPFHVIGLPPQQVRPDTVPGILSIGPFVNVTPDDWKKYFDRWKKDSAGKRADWFDFTYYNGPPLVSTVESLHFLYEEWVVYKYRSTPSANRDLFSLKKSRGLLPSWWSQDMGVKKMMHLAAQETFQRIGTRLQPGPLWVDSSWLRTSTPLPVEDFWRAVQLTYVVWRSSFSALVVTQEDLLWKKVPNSPGRYQLMISVNNMEPEHKATNIKVHLVFNGLQKKQATVDFPMIEANSISDWKETGIEAEFKDSTPPEARLGVAVKSQFMGIPDSGSWTGIFRLDQIPVKEGITVPNVFGCTEDFAKDVLGGPPYFFKVKTMPDQENPPTAELQHRVSKQSLAHGSVAAPGDTIILHVFGKRMVPVPDVLHPIQSESSAKRIIDRVGLVPDPVPVKSENPVMNSRVLDQDPASGLLPYGSKVRIYVGKYTPPDISPPPSPVTDLPVFPETPAEPDQGPPDDPGRPVVIASIGIIPGSASCLVEKDIGFTAVFFDFDGREIPLDRLQGIQINWTVNNASAASAAGFGNNGIIHCARPGEVLVVCTAGGAMGMAALSIQDLPRTGASNNGLMMDPQAFANSRRPLNLFDPPPPTGNVPLQNTGTRTYTTTRPPNPITQLGLSHGSAPVTTTHTVRNNAPVMNTVRLEGLYTYGTKPMLYINFTQNGNHAAGYFTKGNFSTNPRKNDFFNCTWNPGELVFDLTLTSTANQGSTAYYTGKFRNFSDRRWISTKFTSNPSGFSIWMEKRRAWYTFRKGLPHGAAR